MKIHVPKLLPHQQKALDLAQAINLVCGGRRAGKSVLANELVLQVLEGKLIGLVMPNFPSSLKRRDELFTTLEDVIVTRDLAQKRAKFVNGGELIIFSGDALDNMRGHALDLLILDEAAYFNDLKAAMSAGVPTLVDRKGSMWLFSSYKTGSYFSQLFDESVSQNIQKTFLRIEDNPLIDLDYLQTIRGIMSEEDFQEEFYGIAKQNDAYSYFHHIEGKETQQLKNHTLWLSWDFNIGNVNCLVAFKENDTLNVIDHLTGKTIHEVCDKLLFYPQVKTGNCIVTGDASGNNREAAMGLSYYHHLKNILQLGNHNFKVPNKNPLHTESRTNCNTLLMFGKVNIDPKLKVLLNSMHLLKCSPEGQIIKADNLDHPCDAMRYLLLSAYNQKFVDQLQQTKGIEKPTTFVKGFWLRNKETGAIIGFKPAL